MKKHVLFIVLMVVAALFVFAACDGFIISTDQGDIQVKPIDQASQQSDDENEITTEETQGDNEMNKDENYSTEKNESKDDENHSENDYSEEGTESLPHTHTFSAWVILQDATCLTDGLRVRVCTCGESERETIQALGHDVEHHEAEEPTCTEKGWESYETCSRCDYTTYEEIEELGHDWGVCEIIQAPTQSQEGEGRYSCYRCNQQKIITIPADSKGFNGHYYKVYSLDVSWKEAKTICENLGGHLATITSSEEQAFIETFSTGKPWIGATDEKAEGTWEWITGETWDYTNWGSGEPNNSGDEDYLVLFPRKWNDLPNTFGEQFGFICEWDGNGNVSNEFDYLSSSKEYNGHYYYCFELSKTWEDAEFYCEDLGGHLLTITNEDENAWIADNFNAINCWLGGYKENDQWYWVTEESCSYFNWYIGEPNNYRGVEDKMNYWGQKGKWSDSRGDDSAFVRFICEWDSFDQLMIHEDGDIS